MTDLRQYRENEQKVNEHLYNNVFLLTFFYPTTKEFNSVFKKDMFVKSNKAAFYEIVYFLLNILDQQLTKEKLTMWPPYDIKRENKFRSELLKYINELNTLYNHADIPILMASHLISPGGFKFSKFMLKLSQLVIYEHIRKHGEDSDLMTCPKPNPNITLTKVTINNFKKKTTLIEEETNNNYQNFERLHLASNEKAVRMAEELTKLNDCIRDSKKQYTELEKEFANNHPSYPSIKNLEEKLVGLKEELKKTAELKHLFNKCEKLMMQLSSTDFVLEYNNQEFQVPEEITHTVSNKEELDLIQFFNGLNVLLERRALELPNLTDSFIKTTMERIHELDKKYQEMVEKYKAKYVELQEVIHKMKSKFKTIELKLKTEEETLAVPLDEC